MRNDLTQFGRRCRELRSRYGFTMADQSKGTGFSPAYISLIELGKRPVPDQYPEQFAHWISLTKEEAKHLSDLAFGSTSVIELKSSDQERAEIAKEFAKTFNVLPIENLREMRALLASSPERSYTPRQISDLAGFARSLFNSDNRADVDLLTIIENHIALVDPSFVLHVRPDAEFGGAMEAHTVSNGKRVEHTVVSERLYTTAAQRNPYSRYQLAHEFAHWFLHRHLSRAFYRASSIPKKSAKVENEADFFARAFLFPQSLIEKYDNPEKLARAVCIPVNVAKRAIADRGQRPSESRERILQGFDRLINDLNNSGRLVTASPSVQPSLRQESTARVIPFPNAHETPLKARNIKRKRFEQNSEDLFSYADRVEPKSRPVQRDRAWYNEHGWR